MSLFRNVLCQARQRRFLHDCPINAIQPLRLLLLGSPGSGKGTQSERLQKHFGVLHVSSGDLLRQNIQEKTPIGKQAASYMTKGQLVPDPILISLIDQELNQVATPHWLLDGFPRTLPQAKALDDTLTRMMQPLNIVINLEVPEQVILERIMDRWVHIPSGRVYNLSYNPPQVAGRDDETGEPLSRRPDDCPEVFRVRMQQYKQMVTPLLDYYRDIAITIKGNTSDEIYPKIEREIVNRLGLLPGTGTPMPTVDLSAFSAAAVAKTNASRQRAAMASVEEERIADSSFR
ncbi:adenylate kinase [Hesseltinella vesiculosa]|uniref:GTP:AMP phosphotransferase, mitochondrial n=1 Tax=Hesseltinella vesiculosa TaxID=101127 RepID=A0A1X2GFP6_9FUNG|nr:adenylate kinase [Hesseltinella vesiculosa]